MSQLEFPFSGSHQLLLHTSLAVVHRNGDVEKVPLERFQWPLGAAILLLVLQAVLFQFGGITGLGVNTIIMALPAVFCYFMCSPFLHKKSALALTAAFACGFLSVALSALILALALVFTEENFFEVSAIVIAAHIPVMIIEGLVTAMCVAFLKKVQPSMLPGYFK